MTSDSDDNTKEPQEPELPDDAAASGSPPPQARGALRPQARPPEAGQETPGPEPPAGEAEAGPPPGLLQPRGALRPAQPRGRSLRPAENAAPRTRRGRALSGDVLPAPMLGATPYYLPDDDEPSPEGLLRNPYVLAALAVAGAIVLAVLVVFIFGGSGGGAGNGDPNVIIDPLTPAPGRGVTARSIATATVREGPAAEYLEIGLLRSGQDVEAVGRNTDASWFEIFYPPRSQLRGWVPASALRLPDGTSETLPVVSVTPIPRPTVIQPTPEPLPTETVTPTPGAAGGPDLAISIVGNNCSVAQPLVVMIRNAGTTPIVNREIRVIISTPAGVVSVASLSAPSLDPGASLPVQTNQPAQPPRTTVRVELLGSPTDISDDNNAIDCVVQGGQPQETPTPTRTPRP
ncbi:MAG: hypothetical protein GEU75_00835 [Dehalococcoidia bacterium]|nr:hypothetical protein [Dehalococcoidia bacterium]